MAVLDHRSLSVPTSPQCSAACFLRVLRLLGSESMLVMSAIAHQRSTDPPVALLKPKLKQVAVQWKGREERSRFNLAPDLFDDLGCYASDQNLTLSDALRRIVDHELSGNGDDDYRLKLVDEVATGHGWSRAETARRLVVAWLQEDDMIW